MSIDFHNLDTLGEAELVRLIKYHNELYWTRGTTEITDQEYDLLIRQLARINPSHPLIEAVNAPSVASSGKVHHAKPMLSLDKAYSLPEVLSWARKYARSDSELFLVQPKYDGISANYSGTILATRGDGTDGEDITDKIPLIELESAAYKGPLDRPVRGEIVIRDDDFKTLYSKIFRKDGRTYKNSRNAVAGIMGLKEIDEMLLQKAKLTLVDYELVSFSVKLSDFEAEWPVLLQKIEALPYPMDGLVIKLADSAYSESLGFTAHHPRGQIAFKFSGVRKKTKLLNVEWSFGKNCLTPVAVLEPVDINGTTIRHASLHNLQNIIDKDIQIGDTVEVERAGDVIPYIVSAEPAAERISALITNCPSCNSALIKDLPELRCINPDCLETRLQRLLAAVRNIGIEHLGEPNIRKMMNTLNVRTLKNIFDLTLADILRLDGFQAKSASNLYKEIQSSRNVPDFQLLAAMNIYGIGKNVAKSILTEYTLSELRTLNKETLSKINGIGPERASALETELKQQSEFLDELLKCVELIQTKGSSSSSADKPTICFTGKMPEQRSFYENLALKHGWEPSDSVSSSLSLLVAADPNENSSKLKKARSSGIKIMQLEDWLKSLETLPETAHPLPAAALPDKATPSSDAQMTFDFFDDK